MIVGIELSKSDRARCNKCGKVIGKGTPRGFRDTSYKNYSSNRFYCYNCTLMRIEEGILYLKKLKIDFKKMIKKNQKAIILERLSEVKK